jgi:hypothetical protein
VWRTTTPRLRLTPKSTGNRPEGEEIKIVGRMAWSAQRD